MGAELVAQVIETCEGLSNRQWRVLLVMAQYARDISGIYAQGHGRIARTLGYRWPEGHTEEAARVRHISTVQVGAVIRQLKDAGHVEEWHVPGARISDNRQYVIKPGGIDPLDRHASLTARLSPKKSDSDCKPSKSQAPDFSGASHA